MRNLERILLLLLTALLCTILLLLLLYSTRPSLEPLTQVVVQRDTVYTERIITLPKIRYVTRPRTVVQQDTISKADTVVIEPRITMQHDTVVYGTDTVSVLFTYPPPLLSVDIRRAPIRDTIPTVSLTTVMQQRHIFVPNWARYALFFLTGCIAGYAAAAR